MRSRVPATKCLGTWYNTSVNSKELMSKVLSGECVMPGLVVLHSWGDYKVELAGHSPKFQYYQGGEELARIESGFFERFRPDWMHLGSAAWCGFWDRPRKVENGETYIRSADGSRWIRIRDDYNLEDYGDVPWWGAGPALRLESKAAIDGYFAAHPSTIEEILACGRFRHMEIVAREFGDEVLIAINDGAPASWLPDHTFDDMMLACVEKPDLVAHFIFRDCERFLTSVRAAKSCGAHAYIFSEGFGGSLDSISPEMHERLEGDTKRWFYSEVRKAGLLPIGYWLGDVRPNMRLINSLDMAGLMVEEDKKTFALDPAEIRKMLRPEIALFGNVDSTLLRNGTPGEIRAAVRKQKQASEYGPFITANGSPIVIGTPPANVDAFMGEARK